MSSALIEESTKVKTRYALLWLGIVSIVMLFAGLTSAYIIRQAKGEWLHFELPPQFYISTAIIVVSSISLAWAQISAKNDRFQSVNTGVGITWALGISFIFFQVQGWDNMVENGIFFTGPGSNVAASFLYVLTALHAAHAIGGIAALSVTFYNSLQKKYYSKKIVGLQLCSTYWHFMGALWIYLFVFFLYVR